MKNFPKAKWNLSPQQLIEAALKNGEARLCNNGSLVATTGKRTGRSPKDKFIVRNPESEKQIGWGEVNRPMSSEVFHHLLEKVTNYLQAKEVFIHDGAACADPEHSLNLRIVTEFAWHNLFATQLFLRHPAAQLGKIEPNFQVIVAPRFLADPKADGTDSEAFIILNLEEKIVLIGGTEYAGEIKKSIFSTLNFLLPQSGIMPMHCSANIGAKEDVALFFGLSGTGKTTLSADPNRRLIGDDEHGWNHKGVFNLEGGCYAKCIRLSEKLEPQIWKAIRSGTVLENVVMDAAGHVDFDSDAITENTRAAYPIDFIDNAVLPSVGGHPRTVLFLTCDAFGVLPPISQLTPEQAMVHFLSGYTAKLAGTETGVKEPLATFSACFGAPFLPLPPTVYANLFGKKLREHKANIYLVNTGWSGGAVGVGQRISLPHTRALVTAALSGDLDCVTTAPHPIFGLSVPQTCPHVPTEILNPENTWKDKGAYQTAAKKLAQLFDENFKKFN